MGKRGVEFRVSRRNMWEEAKLRDTRSHTTRNIPRRWKTEDSFLPPSVIKEKVSAPWAGNVLVFATKIIIVTLPDLSSFLENTQTIYPNHLCSHINYECVEHLTFSASSFFIIFNTMATYPTRGRTHHDGPLEIVSSFFSIYRRSPTTHPTLLIFSTAPPLLLSTTGHPKIN